MFHRFKYIATDVAGASTAEYAALLASVGAAVVAATLLFNTGLSAMFTAITNLMSGWVS